MLRSLANLDGLMRLSRTQGVDIRPALLRVITDLFVQERNHTREEAQQYVELALRLLPVVDPQTRAAVAAKIAAFPATPPALFEYLSAQGLLTGATARAPQQPLDLPLDVWTASDPAVPQPAAGAGDATARPLGDRFLAAGPDERRAILLELDDAAEIDDAAWSRGRPVTIARLEAAAALREPRDFIRELQHSFGLSLRIASEVARDESGEPLLVVAAAIRMPPDSFLRILLLLNSAVGESVERVFGLYRLYPHVGRQAAATVMASWREESRARPRTRFQPLYAPDAVPSRGGGARDGGRPDHAAEPASERAGAERAGTDRAAKRHGAS